MSVATIPTTVPELLGDRVRLRALTSADVPGIVETARDPETMAWTTLPRDYTDQHAADFVAMCADQWRTGAGERAFAIEQQSNPGGYAGTVGVQPKTQHHATLGFSLHPQARGHGVMSDAIRTACRWWFGLGGETMGWAAFVGNLPSARAVHAAGLTFDAGVSHRLMSDNTGTMRDCWTAVLHADDPMQPGCPWSDVVLPQHHAS